MQDTNYKPVSVIKYSFTNDNWLKEVKYTLRVISSSGETEIMRSAKDFKTLRKVLVVRWPGCIIPAVPEELSKVVGI